MKKFTLIYTILLFTMLLQNSIAATLKTLDLQNLTVPASSDVFEIIDVSDTNMGDRGTNKKITYNNLFSNVGNITLQTTAGIQSGTTDAATFCLNGWDVNDSVYRCLGLMTTGNTPSLLFAGSANATVSVLSATLGIVAAPVVVTASNITLTNGASLRSGLTDEDVAYLSVYENDTEQYRAVGALTSGNTPGLTLGGTANAYVAINSALINNSTIGATTPSTGAFTTLTTSGTVSHAVGTSTSTYFPAGTIQRDLVDVGNIGTGEDTLITETVVANSLPTGRCLVFKGNGATAANANTKAIRFTYSGVALLTVPTTAFPAVAVYRWGFTIKLCGTATNVQEYDTNFEVAGGAAVVSDGNTTIDTSIASNATILATGTADNDIVAKALHIGIE